MKQVFKSARNGLSRMTAQTKQHRVLDYKVDYLVLRITRQISEQASEEEKRICFCFVNSDNIKKIYQ